MQGKQNGTREPIRYDFYENICSHNNSTKKVEAELRGIKPKEIKTDLKDKQSDLKDDLLMEVENATKHLKNNKDITSRLKTIGGLIKDVGINVFADLAAAPIYDQIKPLLGI